MSIRKVMRKILVESAAGKFLSRQDATKIEVRIRNAILQVDKEREARKQEFAQSLWKKIEGGEGQKLEKPNRLFQVTLSPADGVEITYHFLVVAEPFAADDLEQAGVIAGDTGKPLDVMYFDPTDLSTKSPEYWNSIGIFIGLNKGMSAEAVIRDWESYWDQIFSLIEARTEYHLRNKESMREGLEG